MNRQLEEDGDGPTVRSPRKRRSNVMKREPLAEIKNNNEKELRRSERRKNKRVSFSETTTIATFLKDNSRDSNESNNDKTQLFNQFKVAAETIEGVLDVSGQSITANDDFNATTIDEKDMLLLSDSSQSSCTTNPNRTLSMEAGSTDSITNAKGFLVLEEMDVTTRSSSSKTKYGKPVQSKFETTVICGEDICDATMLSSNSLSFVTDDSIDLGKLMDTTKLDSSMNLTTMNKSTRGAIGFLMELDTSIPCDQVKDTESYNLNTSSRHSEITGTEIIEDTNTKLVSSVKSPRISKCKSIEIESREPPAEIKDNNEEEPRRSKRRNNKRVSFSDTTSVALFAKDNSRELNMSANNNTQLVNQFNVAAETIEGVLDESTLSEHNKSVDHDFNVTMIDGDTLSLSDSSQCSEVFRSKALAENEELDDSVNIDMLKKMSTITSTVKAQPNSFNEFVFEATVNSEKEMCSASMVSEKSLSSITEDSIDVSKLMDITKVNSSLNLTAGGARGLLMELDTSIPCQQVKDKETLHLNTSPQHIESIGADADMSIKHRTIIGTEPEYYRDSDRAQKSTEVGVSCEHRGMEMESKCQMATEVIENVQSKYDSGVDVPTECIEDTNTKLGSPFKSPRRSKCNSIDIESKEPSSKIKDSNEKEPHRSKRRNNKRVSFSDTKSVALFAKDNSGELNMLPNDNKQLVNKLKVAAKTIEKVLDERSLSEHKNLVDANFNATVIDGDNTLALSDSSECSGFSAQNEELDNSANIEVLKKASTVISTIKTQPNNFNEVGFEATVNSEKEMCDASMISAKSISLVTDDSMDVSDVFMESTEAKCDSVLNVSTKQDENIDTSLKCDSDANVSTKDVKSHDINVNMPVQDVDRIDLCLKYISNLSNEAIEHIENISGDTKSDVNMECLDESKQVNVDIDEFGNHNKSICTEVEANTDVNISGEVLEKVDIEVLKSHTKGINVTTKAVGTISNCNVDGASIKSIENKNTESSFISNVDVPTDHVSQGSQGGHTESECLHDINVSVQGIDVPIESRCDPDINAQTEEIKDICTESTGDSGVNVSTQCLENIDMETCFAKFVELLDKNKEEVKEISSSAQRKKRSIDKTVNVASKYKSDVDTISKHDYDVNKHTEVKNVDTTSKCDIDFHVSNKCLENKNTELISNIDVPSSCVEVIHAESEYLYDSNVSVQGVENIISTCDAEIKSQTDDAEIIRTESTGDSGVNVSSECFEDTCTKSSFIKNKEESVDRKIFPDGLNQNMHCMEINDLPKSCASIPLSKRRASSKLNHDEMQVFHKYTKVAEVEDFQLHATDFGTNVSGDKATDISVKGEQDNKTCIEVNESNNEITVEQNLAYNDTSWLSHGDLQEFADSVTEEEERMTVDFEDGNKRVNLTLESTNQVYNDKMNTEVDNLVNCFSQNSLTVDNWDTVKDETVSEKIASAMSRIKKLKAQNKLYNSQNQSYRQHSITEKSFNYTPSKPSSDSHKFNYTIVKASGADVSCMSSDSWIAEPTNHPIANSSRIPVVSSKVDIKEKDVTEDLQESRKHLENLEEMKQSEFPLSCVIEYEDNTKLIVTFKSYTCHKFIINYCSKQLTDIIAERNFPQWMEAEEYFISFMYNAINITKLKRDFTAVSQVPELLHSICSSIEMWMSIAHDIYYTFYKFLGRVKLEKDRIVVKFFVDKIWTMFSLVIKFDIFDKPFSECSLRHSDCGHLRHSGIFDVVKDALHSVPDVHKKMPLLSCCEHIESFCKMLADGSIKVGDKHASEPGKEVSLDIDVLNMKQVLQ